MAMFEEGAARWEAGGLIIKLMNGEELAPFHCAAVEDEPGDRVLALAMEGGECVVVPWSSVAALRLLPPLRQLRRKRK